MAEPLPPPQALIEASLQHKKWRIEQLRLAIAKIKQEERLEPFVEIEFGPMHHDWAKLCAVLSLDSTKTLKICLAPWPDKGEDAWRVFVAPYGSFDATEFYTTASRIFEAFA